MEVIATALPDVLILEPRVFGDDRGFFYESFNAQAFRAATGIDAQFVQDNHSRSLRGVLRGLHYQVHNPQGKLVRVTAGEVLDVAVDIRRSSPPVGKWAAVRLSADNHRQLWVPEGFAHGFVGRVGVENGPGCTFSNARTTCEGQDTEQAKDSAQANKTGG